MSQKLNRLIEPHDKLFYLLLLVFSVVTMVLNQAAGVIELGLTLLAIVATQIYKSRQKKTLTAELTKIGKEIEASGKDTMLNAPFPMVIFRPDTEEVIWCNDLFLGIIGEEERDLDAHITALVPDLPMDWLEEGELPFCPQEQRIGDRRYQVFGRMTGGDESRTRLATTFWIDVTDYVETREQFYATRPTVSFIIIDNYEEMMRGISEKGRAGIRSAVEEKLADWVKPSHGLLLRYERGRYLLVCEEQYMHAYQEGEFTQLLDTAHEVLSPNGINATLSLGIGMDQHADFHDLYEYASLALDMALSRGGDQAVIRSQNNFSFYGGHSQEREVRTKVKIRVTANALERLIATASRVFVMGHRNGDMDCAGAAAGVAAICRKKGVPVSIIAEERAVPATVLIKRLSASEAYQGVFLSAEDAMLLYDERSILVVVDTNRPSQVAAPELLEKFRQVAVIDHHRRATEYITGAAIKCHEPFASSACVLVTVMIQYFMEASDLLRVEAEALLAGIVLDTKSFAVRTGGRTFEAAAFLRRCGADTMEVKRLFQNNLPDTIKKNAIIQSATMYRDGVAIAATTSIVGRVIAAQAADAILNVEGVDTSFVLYFDGDTAIISGRSTGDINVQVILETLGGGGNSAAAGAQIPNATMEGVTEQLHRAIDGYFSGRLKD